MGYKRKANFQGREVDAEDLEFETEKECWNSYILEDGTRLKMKSVVAKVLRLEAFNDAGEPIYLVNSSNLLSADVPENLKERKE